HARAPGRHRAAHAAHRRAAVRPGPLARGEHQSARDGRRQLQLAALRRADGGGLRARAAGPLADPPMKPVLFVTNYAPPYRVGAFARLHEREDVEYALFGGRLKHGGGSTAEELPFPHRHVREHTLKGVPHVGAHPPGRIQRAHGRQASELYGLAASGRYRAVVVSTGGRGALPAAWAGARRARVPLILWASLWAHPRSGIHALSYMALLRLYRSADAVVSYGPHVSSYVQARGARRVHIAPQAVDNAFWASPDVSLPSDPRWPAGTGVKFLFAGRPAREKGLGVLVEAWSTSGLQAPTAALVLVGAGSTPPWVP